MAIREHWIIYKCDCGRKFAICPKDNDEFDDENIECPVCGNTPHSSFCRHMDMLTIDEELVFLKNN